MDEHPESVPGFIIELGFSGDAPKPGYKIVERYQDAEPIGVWANITMKGLDEPGEVTDNGTLLRRTVKIRHPDGSIRLDSEWYPDR